MTATVGSDSIKYSHIFLCFASWSTSPSTFPNEGGALRESVPIGLRPLTLQFPSLSFSSVPANMPHLTLASPRPFLD